MVATIGGWGKHGAMLRPGDLPSALAAMQYFLGFLDTERVRHGHLTIVVHAPTTTTTRDCHQL